MNVYMRVLLVVMLQKNKNRLYVCAQKMCQYDCFLNGEFFFGSEYILNTIEIKYIYMNVAHFWNLYRNVLIPFPFCFSFFFHPSFSSMNSA